MINPFYEASTDLITLELINLIDIIQIVQISKWFSNKHILFKEPLTEIAILVAEIRWPGTDPRAPVNRILGPAMTLAQLFQMARVA